MERLDKILVEKNLFESRTKAEFAILAKQVKVDGCILDKPGKKVNPNSTFEISNSVSHYVSRGAFKLIEALEKFEIDPNNLNFIDLGASTGGFTQVLLERNCKKVYCVDVGSGQLHGSLVHNTSIVNLEKTHIKDLNPSEIDELVDGIVVDVSFISLTKVLPFLPKFLKPDGFIITLIKPQFEVGKSNLSKNGIVKNEKLYQTVLESIKISAIDNYLIWVNSIESPILGGDGNKEFLCLLRKASSMDV